MTLKDFWYFITHGTRPKNTPLSHEEYLASEMENVDQAVSGFLKVIQVAENANKFIANETEVVVDEIFELEEKIQEKQKFLRKAEDAMIANDTLIKKFRSVFVPVSDVKDGYVEPEDLF